MLYIVRVFEYGDKFEYEYGNIGHAEYHYAHEKTAEIWEYNLSSKKMILVKQKINEKEMEV